MNGLGPPLVEQAHVGPHRGERSGVHQPNVLIVRQQGAGPAGRNLLGEVGIDEDHRGGTIALAFEVPGDGVGEPSARRVTDENERRAVRAFPHGLRLDLDGQVQRCRQRFSLGEPHAPHRRNGTISLEMRGESCVHVLAKVLRDDGREADQPGQRSSSRQIHDLRLPGERPRGREDLPHRGGGHRQLESFIELAHGPSPAQEVGEGIRQLGIVLCGREDCHRLFSRILVRVGDVGRGTQLGAQRTGELVESRVVEDE